MDAPSEYLVEGPDPDHVEEPAVAEVDPPAAVDEALGIDVDDVLASERERAELVEHTLTHPPANRYCEACLRGKMQEVCRFTGVFSRSLTKCGQTVTLDPTSICRFFGRG